MLMRMGFDGWRDAASTVRTREREKKERKRERARERKPLRRNWGFESGKIIEPKFSDEPKRIL